MILRSQNKASRLADKKRVTRSHSNSGHTLIEVLMVVLVLVTIVVILLPVINTGKRSARSAMCIKNLQQLNNGRSIAMHESKSNDKLRESLEHGADAWTTYLWPYLKEKNFVCPESEKTHASSPLNQLMIGVHIGGNNPQSPTISASSFDQVAYFMELDASRPWVKKLSWEQFEDFKLKLKEATGHEFDAIRSDRSLTGPYVRFAVDYWRNSYPGYIPGDDPNHYVLMMEDFRRGTQSVTDLAGENFVDFMITVEPADDPTLIKVTASHNALQSPEAGFLVWSDTQEPVHSPVTAMQLHESRTIELQKSLGSYGANPNQVFNTRAQDERLVFLDYEYIIATPDNWDDWDDKSTGIPDYARHLNNIMNVSYVDGSVRMSKEHEINPSIFSIEQLYWSTP